MQVSGEMLYLTDNGAVLCGAHLGATAKATGCDLSGQPIEPLTPDLLRACRLEFGYTPFCEQCAVSSPTPEDA